MAGASRSGAPLALRAQSRARRCAYCHEEDLSRWSSARCGRCGVALHEECAEDLACCPSLGCGAWAPAPPPLWLRALDLGLTLLILGALGLVALNLVGSALFGAASTARGNAFPGLPF